MTTYQHICGEMKKEQAIKLAESKWWVGMDAREIVGFQLFEDLLCMNFGDFHLAIEKVLGRPVFSHEFAYADKPNGLKAEFLGVAPKRSLEDIINLVPEEKRIVLVAP